MYFCALQRYLLINIVSYYYQTFLVLKDYVCQDWIVVFQSSRFSSTSM